jgi:hypothetical protein|tara:strand:- start:6714 stop:7058 length:345 start_codon:yes stop_codon:yes gene_type:complete
MANGMNAFDDYYQSMLESDPQTAYLSAIGAANPFTGRAGERARSSIASQFGDVYNQYLGVKGDELRRRTDPSQMTSFTDFLARQPFTSRYGALTPGQKGMSTRRYAPSTRFIYF